MEAVKKTWKPTVGGILSVIAGGCYLLATIGVIIAIIVIAVASNAPFLNEMWRELARQGIGPGLLFGILVIVAVYLAAVGVLSLLGGISALKRERWGLALAGSIAAIVGGWSALGVVALIFIAIVVGVAHCIRRSLTA